MNLLFGIGARHRPRRSKPRIYKPSQLVYAAEARCPCGADLAHPRRVDPFDGYWDCSAILTGAAVPSGEPGSVTHTAQLPFIFYEVKSEQEPSAHGATTRPEVRTHAK